MVNAGNGKSPVLSCPTEFWVRRVHVLTHRHTHHTQVHTCTYKWGRRKKTGREGDGEKGERDIRKVESEDSTVCSRPT